MLVGDYNAMVDNGIGAETTWVFGIVVAGLHYFRWECTGAVTAAEESTFNAVIGPRARAAT